MVKCDEWQAPFNPFKPIEQTIVCAEEMKVI